MMQIEAILRPWAGGIPTFADTTYPVGGSIGKTCWIDFRDADPWDMDFRILLEDHGLNGKAIHDLGSQDAAMAAKFQHNAWPTNPGIRARNDPPFEQPTKKTPLDIDMFVDGDADRPRELMSHVVMKMSASNGQKIVKFSRETQNGVALVVTQALTDVVAGKGRVTHPRVFDVGNEEFVEFFVSRGLSDRLINFNLAIEYHKNGRVTPMVIDPGMQNQRP